MARGIASGGVHPDIFDRFRLSYIYIVARNLFNLRRRAGSQPAYQWHTIAVKLPKNVALASACKLLRVCRGIAPLLCSLSEASRNGCPLPVHLSSFSGVGDCDIWV